MVVLPDQGRRAGFVSGRGGHGLDFMCQPVMGDGAQQLGHIGRIRRDGEDGYVAGMAGGGAQAQHTPMGADIDEHIAGLEMGIEKRPGRIFEPPLAGLALDQMFDRQIIEKRFGDRQGKARIAVGIVKYGRQEACAVGRGFQTNRTSRGIFARRIIARHGWGRRIGGGACRRETSYEPRLANLSKMPMPMRIIPAMIIMVTK